VKRVLRSLQLARRGILQSKEKSVSMIAKFLSVDRQAAEDTYGDLARTSSGSGVPTSRRSPTTASPRKSRASSGIKSSERADGRR
jgi:hypothetical protein